MTLRRSQRDRLNRTKLTLLAHKSRQHRYWVYDILRKRKEFGTYYDLVNELELDKDKNHEYFRMSAEKLEHVLENPTRDVDPEGGGVRHSARLIPPTWKRIFLGANFSTPNRTRKRARGKRA